MQKSDWRSTRHLFHVHTSHTDGELTAGECVDFAENAGARTVVFLEHIRRESRYDVELFASEVMLAGRESVRTILGFEAKLLPDGMLDISDDCLARAAVVGIAEHGFPNNRELLRDTVLNVFRTYPVRWPEKIFVWVHPGLWYRKHQMIAEHDDSFKEMLTAAREAGILIEQNLRYGLPSPATASSIPAQSLITGADAHTLLDLKRWAAQLSTSSEHCRATSHRVPPESNVELGTTLP